MNATLQTIMSRHSCRGYKDETPSAEMLDAIATAAVAAPSAMNLQAWKIVVVKDKALIGELDAEGMKILKSWEDQSTYNRMMERGGKLLYNAPTMFMVFIDSKNHQGAALDGGIVTQNIALAASSLGLGNVICGMAAIPFAGERGVEFKKRVNWPEGYELGMTVLVGHPADSKEPHEPDRTKISYVG